MLFLGLVVEDAFAVYFPYSTSQAFVQQYVDHLRYLQWLGSNIY